MRGYGQVDPKNEYKREGFQLFEKLFEAIEDEVTSLVMRIEVQRPQPGAAAPQAPQPRLASPVGRPQPPQPAPAPQAAPAPQQPKPQPQPQQRPAPRPGVMPLGGLPASRAFDVARRMGQQQPPKGDGKQGKPPAKG